MEPNTISPTSNNEMKVEKLQPNSPALLNRVTSSLMFARKHFWQDIGRSLDLIDVT